MPTRKCFMNSDIPTPIFVVYVAVRVKASVVRVYEPFQEQLLKLQVTLTNPKGLRVIPFMFLF